MCRFRPLNQEHVFGGRDVTGAQTDAQNFSLTCLQPSGTQNDRGGIAGLIRSILIIVFLSLFAGCSASSPINAKALQNPVPSTEKSIAAGKIMYDKYCADCHGVTGNGVSQKAQKLAEAGSAKPSDLTDDKWDHGSTDGEIFVNIRDGVGVNGAMKGLNGKPGVSDEDMWNMVNYIRSLHKKSS